MRHYRKPPKATEFKFEEVEGVKRLIQFSNSTAQAVLLEAPLIELDLFNARIFVSRRKKMGDDPTVASVKDKFPRLANWFYDDEIQTTVFDQQNQSARSCATSVISERLGMPEATIERYMRKK